MMSSKTNIKFTSMIGRVFLVAVILLIILHSYIISFLYDKGILGVSNYIGGNVVFMGSGWYPTYNSDDKSIYGKLVELLSDSDVAGKRILIFKKRHMLFLGSSNTVSFTLIDDISDFYNKANKKNVFTNVAKYTWGSVDIVDGRIFQSKSYDVVSRDYSMLIVSSGGEDNLDEILSIKNN